MGNQWLKEATAVTLDMGPFVDSTNADTEEDGLTVAAADVLLSMNGGALTAKTEASASAVDSRGHYLVNLDVTDTGTLGRLRVYIHVAGALPVWADFMVVPADVYAWLVAGEATRETLDDLGTGVVNYSGPVISSELTEIVQGDDYKTADGTSIDFTSTDWPSLTGATLVKWSYRLAGEPEAAVVTITGTAPDASTVRFELTATQSGAMAAGDKVYAQDVQVTLASGSIRTLIDPDASRITVKPQITPAV